MLAASPYNRFVQYALHCGTTETDNLSGNEGEILANVWVRSTAPPKDKEKSNGIDSYVRDIRKVSRHFSADLVIMSTLYVFNSLDLMKFVFVVLLYFIFFILKEETKTAHKNQMIRTKLQARSI